MSMDIKDSIKKLEEFGFDKMNMKRLKSDKAYKLASSLAIKDFISLNGELSFQGRSYDVDLGDIRRGGCYWCALDVGTSIYQKDNPDTLKYSGIRSCAVLGYDRTTHSLLIWPRGHKKGTTKEDNADFVASPQIISINQLLVYQDAGGKESDFPVLDCGAMLSSYFSDCNCESGKIFKFKGQDFRVKPILKDKKDEDKLKDKYEPNGRLKFWKDSVIFRTPDVDEGELNKFCRILASNISSIYPNSDIQKTIAPFNTLIDYMMNKFDIARYSNDFNSLLDYMFDQFKMFKNDKDLFTQKKMSEMIGLIQNYFEFSLTLFNANSHGININSEKLTKIQDVAIQVGGIYDNVFLGLASSFKRPSGFGSVLITAVNNKTQDIWCYPVDNGRTVRIPLILKPSNFMVDGVKKTGKVKISENIKELAEGHFFAQQKELEAIKNFPIYPFEILSGSETLTYDKGYAKFLYVRATNNNVEKVVEKSQFPSTNIKSGSTQNWIKKNKNAKRDLNKKAKAFSSTWNEEGNIDKTNPLFDKNEGKTFYCSQMIGDEGLCTDRFITIPAITKGVKIGKSYPEVVAFGHMKNLLYRGIAKKQEGLIFAIKKAQYFNFDRARTCIEYLQAIGYELLASKNECIDKVEILIDQYMNNAKQMDERLLNELADMLLFDIDGVEKGE